MSTHTARRFFLAALLLPALAFAQAPDSTAPAELPKARDYVEDQAGVLSEKGRIAIERYCGKV